MCVSTDPTFCAIGYDFILGMLVRLYSASRCIIGGPGFRLPRFGGGLSSLIVLRILAADNSICLRRFAGGPLEVVDERFAMAQYISLSR